MTSGKTVSLQVYFGAKGAPPPPPPPPLKRILLGRSLLCERGEGPVASLGGHQSAQSMKLFL